MEKRFSKNAAGYNFNIKEGDYIRSYDKIVKNQ
jgi:hypothetical protein